MQYTKSNDIIFISSRKKSKELEYLFSKINLPYDLGYGYSWCVLWRTKDLITEMYILMRL